MNINEMIAKRITDHLFELGSEPNSPCHRIEFKGGQKKPLGEERAQGGLCRSAFYIEVMEAMEES
jgi:hypothetical protein